MPNDPLEKLFYVYALVRSDLMLPFYIGKGVGTRMYAHENAARHHKNCRHLKCTIIREVWAAGYEILCKKIAVDLTEQQAYDREIVAIDRALAAGYPLINGNGGGGGRQTYQPTPYAIEHLKKRVTQNWQDPEFRAKQSAARKVAWNRPEYKANMSKKFSERWQDQTYRDKMFTEPHRERLSKKRGNDPRRSIEGLHLIGPDGTIYFDVHFLTVFCQEHDLPYTRMYNMFRRGYGDVQGWRIYDPETKHSVPIPVREVKPRIMPKGINAKMHHGLIGPDGTIYRDIVNMKAFCQEHGLQNSNIRKLQQGIYNSHKGWKALPDDQ